MGWPPRKPIGCPSLSMSRVKYSIGTFPANRDMGRDLRVAPVYCLQFAMGVSHEAASLPAESANFARARKVPGGNRAAAFTIACRYKYLARSSQYRGDEKRANYFVPSTSRRASIGSDPQMAAPDRGERLR